MNLNPVVPGSSLPLAIITGGSRGIGEALIHGFASKGYHIATYGRNSETLSKLKKAVEAKYEVKLYVQTLDASSSIQLQQFGQFCLDLKHPIKVLINNAGEFLPGQLMEEEDVILKRMLSVNLESAYTLTRVLAPSMKESKSGHIFNICSVASLKAYPNGGSYAISKAALMSFSQNLRQELLPFGIKVTSVYPGATWTESWAESGIPEARMMPVSDLVKVIWACYDLSDRTVVEEILLRPQLGDL